VLGGQPFEQYFFQRMKKTDAINNYCSFNFER